MKWRVVFTVLEARNLPTKGIRRLSVLIRNRNYVVNKMTETVSPYVVIELLDKTLKTEVASKAQNPTWNQSFHL